MSIQYVQDGDLFAAPVQALVIPVNCSGTAATGLALQCKQHYPYWFEEYRNVCRDHLIWPGYPVLHSLEIAAKNRVKSHIGADSPCAHRFIVPDAETRRFIAPGTDTHRASGAGTLTATAAGRWIIDFPTREHWWLPSHLIHIEVGLQNLVTLCQNYRVPGMALPMLGCGDEGLRQEQVQPLIEEHLSPLTIPIYIYI